MNDWVLPDGEHRHMSWTLTVFLNEIDPNSDITEQRMMEESLWESKAELDSTFENANGIIYTLSTWGKRTVRDC